MTHSARFITRLTTGTILAALLIIVVAVPAFAAQTTISISIIPGPRTVTIDPGFVAPEVTYSDEVQHSSGSAIVTVDDLSGSGAGWHVTLQATDLIYSGPDGYATIPAENLTITAMGNPVMLAGQPVDAAHGPLSGESGSLDQPRVILAAAPGYGQGNYSQPLALRLDIPAMSQAGSYSGTLIVSIAAGP